MPKHKSTEKQTAKPARPPKTAVQKELERLTTELVASAALNLLSRFSLIPMPPLDTFSRPDYGRGADFRIPKTPAVSKAPQIDAPNIINLTKNENGEYS